MQPANCFQDFYAVFYTYTDFDNMLKSVLYGRRGALRVKVCTIKGRTRKYPYSG